jgi:hypothetical protein
MNNFKWSFTNVYADAADGSKIPAVFIKGYCTILCVLEVLTDDQDQRSILRKPYIPGTHDQEFYYTSSQQPAARTKQLAVIN